MQYLTSNIRGGDYTRAGAASRRVKDHLKRVGADPEAIRRTMIAAYEAEMNVVIHAHRGVLEARLGDCAVEVDVVDEGPGIEDVDLALKEGYSTAPAEARALGFGAGLGLPNIRRNSDHLDIASTPGRGTRVSFRVQLRPACAPAQELPLSLEVRAERCTRCLRCLAACPTGAVRVRDDGPAVLAHLCIDCTSCIGACAPGALAMHAADGEPDRRDAVAVTPALLGAFGAGVGAARVLQALRDEGYDDVRSTAPYETALRAAVEALPPAEAPARPVILPVCPAAVSLIELRFPALLPHLAPLASPWEALQADLGERAATYVVACPSQRTALLSSAAAGLRTVMAPQQLREHLAPRVAGRTAAPAHPGVLMPTGTVRVMRVLEALEDGLLGDALAVEPYLCDGGCAGSPLLFEAADVATLRGGTSAAADGGRALPRSAPYAPRPGVRLDEDMAEAIRKLGRIDEITGTLPGRDCGACGAPSCAALAEDIVMGRAQRALCPYDSCEQATGREEAPS